MNHEQQSIARLIRLARLLDSSWTVPGTQWRFGLDAILGLIPGIGDAAGAVLATYIVWQAKELGVSRWTLARMTANVAIDALIGAVPAVGDLFDAAFKANIRNVELLEKDLARRGVRVGSERYGRGPVIVGRPVYHPQSSQDGFAAVPAPL